MIAYYDTSLDSDLKNTITDSMPIKTMQNYKCVCSISGTGNKYLVVICLQKYEETFWETNAYFLKVR